MRASTELWRPPVLDSSPAEEARPAEEPGEQDGELERQRLREEAREAGYAEGLAQGLREGRAAAGAAAAALERLLAGLAEPVVELEQDLERAVLALTVEIARRVVLHEVTLAPERLRDIVRECLHRVPLRHGGLRLRVNPADREVLLAHPVELPGDEIELCADPGLSPGGCVLEVAAPAPASMGREWEPEGDNDSGEVDARIERRWRQVLAALFDEDLIQ